MSNYYIYPILTAINETDQGFLTYLRGYGRRTWAPIFAFLVTNGREHILIDTGVEEFFAPEEVLEELKVSPQPIESGLRELGIRKEDIKIVIHTHLHHEHCENDVLFPQARFYIQKEEWDFCQDPHPLDHRYLPELLEGLDLVLLEGDQEIVPGIRVIKTPGHTPGGQSIIIDTSKGQAVITGFCVSHANFPAFGPVIPPGIHLDVIAAYESCQRVKELADILLPIREISLAHKRLP
ncbi:N-acyl homoserine lactonase family protein [Thermosulfuriphilus sp.]